MPTKPIRFEVDIYQGRTIIATFEVTANTEREAIVAGAQNLKIKARKLYEQKNIRA